MTMAVTRRAFVGCAVAATVFGLAARAGSPARAQSATEREVSFRWRVPTAHYETVKNSLVFDGKIEEERDTKGLRWSPSLSAWHCCRRWLTRS